MSLTSLPSLPSAPSVEQPFELRAGRTETCGWQRLNPNCPPLRKAQAPLVFRVRPRSLSILPPWDDSGTPPLFAAQSLMANKGVLGDNFRLWNREFQPADLSRMGSTGWDQAQSAHGPARSSAQKDSPGHIFWIIPAFSVSYSKKVKPLTPREKFSEWAHGAYDPLGFAWSAAESAAEHSSRDGFCGYGNGWGGYGKCVGSAQLDSNVSSFFGDFLFPVLMHQDPRYFLRGQGPFGKRVLYAISRVFITRTDSGGTAIAYSGLSGTVLAATASNLYYPRQDRGFGLTLSRIGWDLAGTALFNASAEFWPAIKRKLHRAF